MDFASSCELLAQRVRQARLTSNFTQAEMAARALMSLPAYQRFEQSGRTSLSSFVKILFVLGRQNDLRAILSPTQEVASLDEFERRHAPPRIRAGKRKEL